MRAEQIKKLIIINFRLYIASFVICVLVVACHNLGEPKDNIIDDMVDFIAIDPLKRYKGNGSFKRRDFVNN